jgi:hypothetical protein
MINKKLIVFFKYLLIFSIFILFFDFFYFIIPENDKVCIISNILPASEICDNLKDGYIICTLGNNFWSDFFRDFSENDKRFSHLGIIINDNDKAISVIHSTGAVKGDINYVVEESFDNYIKEVRSIGIFKIKGLESSYISKEAKNYLGVPFDWGFDMYDDSSLYCTELLYVILKKIKPEISLKTILIKEYNKYIIPLEAISNSNDFFEIFYCDK